jgi:hypothetical protein
MIALLELVARTYKPKIAATTAAELFWLPGPIAFGCRQLKQSTPATAINTDQSNQHRPNQSTLTKAINIAKFTSEK